MTARSARRASTLLVALFAALFLLAPTAAHATDGDLYAGGTAYRASTYTNHRSAFGSCPAEWVADINANAGDAGRPILAPEAGSVAVFSTGWGDGYGNSIIWTSTDGREQIHVAHLSGFAATGPVAPGTVIGFAGSTGNSSGDHMHVSRAYDGQPAPLVLSGIQICPTVGLGAQYCSAGPAIITFSVSGVLNQMTYYRPVTLSITVSGVIDADSAVFRLDGTPVASGCVVSAPGTHTLVMSGTSNGTPYSKTVSFTIAAPPAEGLEPVFRFYRPALGTHFFTNSYEERDSVVMRLSGTYTFEGVCYWTNPSVNAQPLYRFYRPSTGTHFYTASEAEMQSVRATLGGTYAFEGQAYNVTSSPNAGCTTVWRFFNRRTGTHFYTADESEKNAVLATLGGTYSLDGEAFWLAR